MNPVESFFHELGFSFTLSKLLPYILALLVGWLIVFLLRRKLPHNRWLRRGIYLLGMGVVFGGYFVWCPIYEGDFTNASHSVAVKGELKVKKKELLVITIPGCRFCAESVARMKELKEINPEIAVRYVVCSTEPAATTDYVDLAAGRFPVGLATHPTHMMEVAGHGFPAFLLTDGKTAKVWSNNEFGVMALDEVVDAF